MMYLKFDLDTSTEENRRRINPIKVKVFEDILKKEELLVFRSNSRTKGGLDSFLLGINKADDLTRFNWILSDGDLPYVCQETYYNPL